MRFQALCYTLFALMMIPPQRLSADYLGASGVLKALRKAETEEKDDATKGEAAELLVALKSFDKTKGQLGPSEAAEQWLSLYDRFDQLPAEDRSRYEYSSDGENLNLQRVVSAMPGPASWLELVKFVESRKPAKGRKSLREGSLKLLVYTLVGNHDAQSETLSALLKGSKDLDPQLRNRMVEKLQETLKLLHAMSGNKKGILESFETTLKNRMKKSESEETIAVPDLVTLAGEKKAEASLRRALVLRNTKLRIAVGDETLRMAQDLALELIDELETPQWWLVRTLDATELYEALHRRFMSGSEEDGADEKTTTDGRVISFSFDGELDPDILDQIDFDSLPPQVKAAMLSQFDHESKTARIYYFLGLVAAGQTDKAYDVAKSLGSGEEHVYLPERALQDLARAGYVIRVYELFKKLLTDDPGLQYWDQFVALGAELRQTEATLAFMREALSRDDMTTVQTLRLKHHLVGALLADDQVEQGVDLMHDLLDMDPGGQSEEAIEFLKKTRGELAIKLANLGYFLDQKTWLEAGLAHAASHSENPGSFFHGESLTSHKGEPLSYVGLLMALGRGDEVEKVILDQMKKQISEARNSELDMTDYNLQAQLGQLMKLYREIGRLDDVIAIMDEFPHWGAKDLAKLSPYFSERANVYLIAAEALASKGHREDAEAILKEVLYENGGLDSAYRLLVELKGLECLPFLETLYALDQFEERPLIWKAHVLRKSGKLDAAQQAAEAAIAVDPSDGEQGRGDRMRVYSGMGEIMAARGNKEKAAFFGEVVKAIRMAEDADRLYNVGLLKRGIAMYRDALSHFADAYCIQSRLALQLESAGDFDAAEEHFRRAYELMPDSFGRVESHCFGCEGVFDSERSQGIAERVLSRLLIERPNKPQVHYLLGYLKSTQDRHAEAAVLYRQAIDLDDQYLSAWQKLAETGVHLQLPPGDRDAIALKQLKLDPLSRHSSPDLEAVSDLGELWRAVEAVAGKLPASPATLYELKASKERLGDAAGESQEHYFDVGGDARTRTPGAVIAGHGLVEKILELIQIAGPSSWSPEFVW